MANNYKHLLLAATLVAFVHWPANAQFEVQGDARVNPDDFELTVFADELNYPVGMVELPDRSLLVAVTQGRSFFSSTSSQILRLVDADNDGVAESREVLADGLPVGGASALRMAGDLLFIAGQGKTPILILRLGEAPGYEVTEVGRLTIDYSNSWMHAQSALQARRGADGIFELFFPLGSKVNFATTTATLPLMTTFGVEATLAGDAIHRVRFRDDDGTLTGIDHEQIATGLRSASGLAFHPQTGDLYFEDNGIDGLTEAIEAHSADEINWIPRDQIGGEIKDFGFPDSYVAYRTGEFVGGQGIPPLFAFTPVPEPDSGSESEGPNEIAFAPPGFPRGLNHGLFVGFHGQFSKGGLANEENPLVYADLTTGEYFHFVSNRERDVGHLDGLLATRNHLFIADISSGGGFGSSHSNSGYIYRLSYIGATAIREMVDEMPDGFELGEAYPNPFNPAVSLRFALPATADGQVATLRVFDVMGQRVATLIDRSVSTGTYVARWDGTNSSGRAVSSGSYLFELRVGDLFMGSRKAMLLK